MLLNSSGTQLLIPQSSLHRESNHSEDKSNWSMNDKKQLQNRISQIRAYTQIKSIYSLSQQQLNCINDKASKHFIDLQKIIRISKFEQLYEEMKNKNNTFRNFVQKLLKMQYNHWKSTSISPSNPILIIWNIIKVLLILHIFVIFPLVDSFGLEIQEFIILQYPLFWGELIVLIIDLLYKFNTLNYNYNNNLKNGTTSPIIKIYVKKYLMNDLGGMLGLILFLFIPNNFVKYIFFLKFKEIKIFIKFVKQVLDPEQKYKNYIQLLSLLYTVAMLAHIFACVWVATGRISNSKNWMELRGIQDSLWVEIYLNALYFSITTMTTVGFGDISASNNYEVGVAICLILFSSCIFAYVFSTITTILKDLDAEQKKCKHDIDLIKCYMNKRGIDKELQAKIQNYLRLTHKHGQSTSELRVFKKLTPQLQQELNEQDKGNILLKQQFFVNNFSYNFYKRIVGLVQEIYLQPGDILPDARGLNIVYKGKLNVQTQQNQQLGTLQVGDNFGLKSLFLEQKPSNTIASSEGFSIIYFISFQNFILALKGLDLEKYYQISEQLRMQSYINLYQKCILCKKDDHEVCQDIVLKINKSLILQKHMFQQDQVRQYKKRKGEKKRTSLSPNFRLAQLIQNSPQKMDFLFQKESISELDEMVEKDSYDDLEYNRNYIEENKNPIKCDYSASNNQCYQTSRKSLRQLIQGETNKDRNMKLIEIEQFESKKQYLQYFPQYNFDKVIQAANKSRRHKTRMLHLF